MQGGGSTVQYLQLLQGRQLINLRPIPDLVVAHVQNLQPAELLNASLQLVFIYVLSCWIHRVGGLGMNFAIVAGPAHSPASR